VLLSRLQAARREQQRAEDDDADARSPELGGDQAHGTRGEGVIHHHTAAPPQLFPQQLADTRMIGGSHQPRHREPAEQGEEVSHPA